MRPTLNPPRPLDLPRVPLVYAVVPWGNRFVVEACRGEVRARVTTSVPTREEAEAQAARLTDRHQALNGARRVP